ncbi:AMP-binding protein [Streptomyces fumanus]|uniref:AMP-binding protein n=1 Tax=Streptomyces fumanus TaxID=67302 RepID=UPI0033FC65D7
MTTAPDDFLTRLGHLAERPLSTALVRCAGAHAARETTAGRLLEDCRSAAVALRRAGVRRGDKAVVMTRDAHALLTAVYGLVRLGAVPVLIEPRAEVRRCLDEIGPGVFVGEPLAHAGRLLLGWGRGHVRTTLVTGRPFPGRGRPPGGGPPAPASDAGAPFPPLPRPHPDALAMIAFTSGSTGRPKGVEYRYATLAGQLTTLAGLLRPTPDDVLLSCFLPFTLLGPLLGMTTVAPQVDHLAPARTRPAHLVGPLREQAATVVAASPTVLGLIVRQALRESLTFPSVRRVLSFGAALRPRLAEALAAVLPAQAEILSVYGATECLPVAAVTGAALRELRTQPPPGHGGTCLGRPLPGVAVRVLDADATGLGEIAVAGPVVSPAYHLRPEATAAARTTADGTLWHRTGDLGRLDPDGRLWYLGRKAHLVTGDGLALTTEDVETAADAVAGVRRTALVGVGAPGRQRAVLCVEPEPGTHRETLLGRLRAALAPHPYGRRIDTVLFHPCLPTDIRHNAKIDRGRLAAYAARHRRGRA